jgi:DNA topoisomerase-1
MAEIIERIEIEKKLIRVIKHDAVKTAEVAGLVYVSSSDAKSGFSRVRNGSEFIYMDGKRVLRDKSHLERIKKLVIPPAWEDVWICKLPNGHLQVTGIDKLGRKQYKYHPMWMLIRNETKFFRLREFGETLPLIKKNLEKDLSLPGYPQEKVLATMVSLLERINIRVGNSFYEKNYGSFGLTTLKDRHVKVTGSGMKIMFRGKKGVMHDINLTSRRLARIVQGCKDIPGKELFQYYDEEGNRKAVDSGMVNEYIRKISGKEFTAKDFRTWAGTINALLAFREVGKFTSATDMNKKIASALDLVAKQLGNTRAVCRKYYVHPVIIRLYQDDRIDSYLKALDKQTDKDETGYTPEERVLLRILRSPVS